MTNDELLKRFGIGLTGGIASGKSTVSRILRNLGFPVIDADVLAREAVEPNSKGLALIVSAFGGGVLNKNGTLNRQLVRDMVFSNPQKKEILEKILHPVISDLLLKHLREMGLFQHPRIFFYEATLLFETGNYQKFREIWLIQCQPQTQLLRLMKRSQLDEATAKKIIERQTPKQSQVHLANVIIDTNSPIEELEAKVRLALENLNLHSVP